MNKYKLQNLIFALDRGEGISEAADALRILRNRCSILAKLAYRDHFECEDYWYSCPKAPSGCANENEGPDCNCGADAHNEEVDAALGAKFEDNNKDANDNSWLTVEQVYETRQDCSTTRPAAALVKQGDTFTRATLVATIPKGMIPHRDLILKWYGSKAPRAAFDATKTDRLIFQRDYGGSFVIVPDTDWNRKVFFEWIK